VESLLLETAAITSGLLLPDLAAQVDGNLVLKDVNGNPYWATDTSNKGPAPYKLVMQVSSSSGVIFATLGPACQQVSVSTGFMQCV
jgi:hypothetical protein